MLPLYMPLHVRCSGQPFVPPCFFPLPVQLIAGPIRVPAPPNPPNPPQSQHLAVQPPLPTPCRAPIPADLILRPVRVVADPIRGAPHVLVMCEVFSPDGKPHPTNTRARLREVVTDKVTAEDPWFGFEQEYTMLDKKTGRPFGWPENGYPFPQVRRGCICSIHTGLQGVKVVGGWPSV